MDNVQNCNTYINIPLSQTYRFYLLWERLAMATVCAAEFWHIALKQTGIPHVQLQTYPYSIF
jgi:hypothetical protein